MAELPELETLRRELEKESVGKRFKAPEVVGAKVTKRNGNKKVFQGRLEGAKVKSVDRRGPVPVGQPRQRRAAAHRPRREGLPREGRARGPPRRRARVVTLAFTQGGQIRLVDRRHRAGVRRGRRQPGRGGPGAGRASASTPSPTRCRGRRSPALLLGPQREAQDAADGPARWWPASARSTATRSSGRPASATTASRASSPARRSAACSGRSSRRSTRP